MFELPPLSDFSNHPDNLEYCGFKELDKYEGKLSAHNSILQTFTLE